MRLFKPNIDKLYRKHNIKGLIAALHDREGLIRAKAASVLGSLKDPQVFGPLVEALVDKDNRVRYQAVQALGQMRGAQVISALMMALKDIDLHVHSRAAEALGEIGVEAVEPLLLSLRARDKELRREAVVALSEIGDLQSLKALTSTLEDEDRDVRYITAKCLERIGVFATPFLAALLKKDDRELRQIAKGILTRIGSSARDGSLVAEWLIQSLVERNERGRQEVTDILLRIGPTTIDPLVRTLQSKDPYIRKWTLSLLEKFHWQPRNDEEKVSYLWAREEWDKLIELGHMALEPLMEALQREYVEVRRKVARALEQISDERAVKALIAALGDRDREVCRCAVKALGKIGDERAIEPLMALWEEQSSTRGGNGQGGTEEDRELHDDVATALVKIGPMVVEPLIKAAQERDDYVRKWAAVVLEQMGDERARDLVKEPILGADIH